VQEPRLAGFFLDKAAKVVDMRVYGPRLHSALVSPDSIEELLTSEDLSAVAHEELEQVERFGCHGELLPLPQEAATGQVDDHGSQRHCRAV
jgi:hypothetical protein